MIKSMTGYGRAKVEQDGRIYTVEIKSVNHKYSDINIRLPRNISYLEEKVKRQIGEYITRGKIDVYINFENNSNIGRNIKLNTNLATLYIEEMRKLAQNENITDDITVTKVVKLPEILEIQSDENEETIWQELNHCVKNALANFISMKQVEGNKMAEDMKARIETISKKIEEISKTSTGLIEDYVVKLETRIQEILKTDIVDQARLEQEVVIYADKCSVEEEITRLESHIHQFNKLLDKKEYMVVGKRLDFLMQEMNRETNTIGSKANCLEITNLVIDIKTELENIREQVQNIE